MKKTILWILLLPLLAGGCAGLLGAVSGETDTIDASTSVMSSDGSIIWAAMLDRQARWDADNKATRQRQVTEPQTQTQWVSVGYDYDFNQGDLNVGIAQGKYKLGPQQHRTIVSGTVGNKNISNISYHEVFLKQTKTVNVTSTVTETDKKLWQQTYAESLKSRQNYILSKLERGIDVALLGTGDTVVAMGPPVDANASPVRKKVMARLEKRLRGGVLPGASLIYGGWTGGKHEQENVLFAYLDDEGSFVCEWLK